MVSGGCVVLRQPRRALSRSSSARVAVRTRRRRFPSAGTVADDRGGARPRSLARRAGAGRGSRRRARARRAVHRGGARASRPRRRARARPRRRDSPSPRRWWRPPRRRGRRPAGSRDAAGIAEKETEKETSPTSPSTVVCLAGAVDVHTLAEEDASDPVAPAEGTRSSEGASEQRQPGPRYSAVDDEAIRPTREMTPDAAFDGRGIPGRLPGGQRRDVRSGNDVSSRPARTSSSPPPPRERRGGARTRTRARTNARFLSRRRVRSPSRRAAGAPHRAPFNVAARRVAVSLPRRSARVARRASGW